MAITTSVRLSQCKGSRYTDGVIQLTRHDTHDCHVEIQNVMYELDKVMRTAVFDEFNSHNEE